MFYNFNSGVPNRFAAAFAPVVAVVIFGTSIVCQAQSKMQARVIEARAVTRNDSSPDAAKNFAEAIAQSPRNAKLAIEHAVFLASKGDGEKAALEYRRAFELEPLNAEAARGFVIQTARLGTTSPTIKELTNQLSAAPDDIAKRLLLAELLNSEARYTEAIDQLWIARRDAPENPLVARSTAEAWLALGFYDEAEKSFMRAAPNDASQQLADKARVLLAAGRAEAALALLESNPKLIENNSSALVALADAFRALGRAAEERRTLESSVERDSTQRLPVLERLARARYESGDKQLARAACNQLLQLDARNRVAAFGLQLLDAPLSAQASNAANSKELTSLRLAAEAREKGEAALFWNKAADAIPDLRRALETWNDSPRLMLALGAALLETNDAKAAAAVYSNMTIAARSPRLDALLGLARAETANANLRLALAIYDNVLLAEPNNFHALYGRAEMHRRLGNDEQAISFFAELAKRTPESQQVAASFKNALAAYGRQYKSGSNLTSDEALRAANNALAASAVQPLLETGDTLRVKLRGRAPATADVKVDDAGQITLPLLKAPLKVRCMTEREASLAIMRTAGEASADAVAIEITSYKRVPLVVAGSVFLPGDFNVRTALDLRESLMLAGGATADASSRVYVIRGAEGCTARAVVRRGNEPSGARVEVYERAAAEAGEVKLTQQIGSGDVVIVPRGDAVFIIGAIAEPKVVKAENALTLTSALRALGGTRENSQRTQIRLLRLLPGKDVRQQFIVNLDDIEQARVGDIILQPGDIVEVPSDDGTLSTNSLAELLRALASSEQLIAEPKTPVKIVNN